MNTITTQSPSQQDLKKISFSQIEQDIIDNPSLYLKSKYSVEALKILDFIIWAYNNWKYLYFTQAYLAGKAGLSHRHTHRLLKEFADLGLIGKLTRDKGQTCLYSVPSFFKEKRITWLLRAILPSVCAFYVCDLMSNPYQTVESGKVVQYNILIENYTNEKETYRSPAEKWAEKEHNADLYGRTCMETPQENSALLSFEEFSSLICS